jgi:membrane protein YdbS with pleckstrin-like domain
MIEHQTPSLYNNLQISHEQLPDAAQIDFTPIQYRYIWKVRMKFLLAPVIPVLAFYFEWTIPTYYWAGTILYAIVILSAFVLQTLSFKRKGFALREKDLSYRTGWLFRSTTTIPFNRIQHCEVENSFVERLFKLSTLNVYTAGGSGSDISIPGLDPLDAKRLRDFIITTAGTHEEP